MLLRQRSAALSIARVVCFCQPIAVMISSSVVPPSRLSISITWLDLLPSRGAPAFVAALGAFGGNGVPESTAAAAG